MLTGLVVNLLSNATSDAVGEHFSGSVAECGQTVAGDLVNSDITVRIQSIGPVQSVADDFFEEEDAVAGAIVNKWVCELEVQTLLNYNKHDSAY